MQVDLNGPRGRLEALVEEGPRPAFAAVICHPHPLYGGTMHNHATYRLAKAVTAERGIALRFNYRGVGLSAGSYGWGTGEADDARAALAFLSQKRPDLPRIACGFSFGAFAAVLAGRDDPGVAAFVIAGLALHSPDPELSRDVTVLRSLQGPLALVQAERDEYGPLSEVEEALAGSLGPRWMAVVPGATHLFTENLSALELEARNALEWALGSGKVT